MADSLIIMTLKRLIIISCVFLVWGCSSPNGLDHPLANRGVLPLSTTNPYLGSNLFLGAESERSKHLYYFLRNRGAPVAIELEDRRFHPPRMLMYYPRNKEVFIADLAQDKQSYEWVVTGPFAIERDDFRSLAELSTSSQGEPVFMIRGQRFKFRFEQTQERPKQVVIPVIPPPPPRPKPVKKPITAPSTEVVAVGGTPAPTIAEAKDPNSITNFKPLTSDQQAIFISQGYAERDANGDVMHIVKSDTETAALIAKWYTGAESNAQEISAVNGLASPTLVTGAKVRVPLKLLKNTKAMPADFK